jgi:hypothetical protein
MGSENTKAQGDRRKSTCSIDERTDETSMQETRVLTGFLSPRHGDSCAAWLRGNYVNVVPTVECRRVVYGPASG